MNASTRPRITFDERGWCNACQWMEEKKTLDWDKRIEELTKLIKRHSGKNEYDCLIAVSGGKDGSYVSHTLKNVYGLNPLCVTVRPPMALEIGNHNLNAFIDAGFEHIQVSPNFNSMRTLDRIGFLDHGQGYFGWLVSIHTAVLRIAKNFSISLIFYSEDGEVEYGGLSERKNQPTYGIDYMKKAYLSSTYEDVIAKSNLDQVQLSWFKFPELPSQSAQNLEVAHFSYFENWDPYRNYLVAKDYCGLTEKDNAVVGTFTNFAQNDQELASLHYYLMYLKFGFGRATQDAGIEIRRGSMTREQAIQLVKLFDGQAPIDGYSRYCEYFQISLQEFQDTIDKFANKSLFEKVNGRWTPRFEIK